MSAFGIISEADPFAAYGGYADFSAIDFAALNVGYCKYTAPLWHYSNTHRPELNIAIPIKNDSSQSANVAMLCERTSWI